MPTVAINGAGAVTIPQLVNVKLSHRTFTRISAIISVSKNALAYFLQRVYLMFKILLSIPILSVG